MNFLEALKSGKPLRRRGKTTWRSHKKDVYGGTLACTSGDAFMHVDYLFDCDLTPEDCLADDWEIQEPTVTITRTQLRNAIDAAKAASVRDAVNWFDVVATELGLKE